MRAIIILLALVAVAAAALAAQPVNPVVSVASVATHAMEPAWMVLCGASLLAIASVVRRYLP
jgi:hypothetical protein